MRGTTDHATCDRRQRGGKKEAVKKERLEKKTFGTRDQVMPLLGKRD